MQWGCRLLEGKRGERKWSRQVVSGPEKRGKFLNYESGDVMCHLDYSEEEEDSDSARPRNMRVEAAEILDVCACVCVCVCVGAGLV